MAKHGKNAVNAAPGFDLLQPEILQRDELICKLKKEPIAPGFCHTGRIDPFHRSIARLLRSRCVEMIHGFDKKFLSIDIDSLSKDELLDVFYTTVLPLSQRRYRQNRRGKWLTLKQKEIDKRQGRKKFEQNALLDGVKRRVNGIMLTDTNNQTHGRLKPALGSSSINSRINLNKRKAETNLDDIVIENKPRKNDRPTLVPMKPSKRPTLAKLTAPKTPLEEVVIKSRNVTSTEKSESHKSCGKIVSLLPPPPKERDDPLAHVVVKEFVKKDKKSNSASVNKDSKTNVPINDKIDTSSNDKTCSGCADTPVNTVKVTSESLPVKRSQSDQTPDIPTDNDQSKPKKRIKLKRPTAKVS